jgi:hypothetical protein
VDTHLLLTVNQMTQLDRSEIDEINAIDPPSAREPLIYRLAAVNGFKCSGLGMPFSVNAVRCWCLEQGINLAGTVMESFGEDGANLIIEGLDLRVLTEAELLIGRWAIDGIARTDPEGFDVICEIRPENIGPLLTEVTALFHEETISVRVF